MGSKAFVLRASAAGVVVAAIGVAVLAGYRYGKQSAIEEAAGQCREAFEAAFVDANFSQAMEARHDRGIVELLHQSRVEDAYRISQERYFSRVLLLPDIARNSSNSVIQQRIVEEVTEAQSMLQSTGFKFGNERDSNAWTAALQHVSDLKRSRPNNTRHQE